MWDCLETYRIWRGLAQYCHYARCKAQSSVGMYVGYHDKYEHQEEGMMLVIKDISFSTIDNVHSIHINAKDQVVLELVNPITL